jgi:hypothetical protein
MERVFGTLQGRLPQLRLAGITTTEGANRWLADHFVAAHNARVAVAAAEPGSAFVPFAGDLGEILCVQAERVVGNDNCVRYGGLSLQIPVQPHRHHFVKVKVRVHAYGDGRLAIFHGPRAWRATRPVAGPSRRRRARGAPPDTARRRAPWTCWTTLPRCPQPHRANSSSGHLMCYETRTSLRAVDTP